MLKICILLPLIQYLLDVKKGLSNYDSGADRLFTGDLLIKEIKLCGIITLTHC
uniref:Uncharacterized protein n=1 Tax=Octopus bimaculoides TaxID=37653 RepID=A0A0L8IFZ0_OCTBM